jgi:hypothetical protein
MVVDDWLRTIEKKLQVVQCSNQERVLFASHQMEVSASEWWDTFVNAHEEL